MESVVDVTPADPALACGPGAAPPAPQPVMAVSAWRVTVRPAHVPLMVLPEPQGSAGSAAQRPARR